MYSWLRTLSHLFLSFPLRVYDSMRRPEVKNTVNGRFKIYVRLRDFSQVVNAQRLAVDDASIFEAVEDGRSRIYSFIFKTLSEVESFASLYVAATLPESGNNDDDNSSSSTNSSGSAGNDGPGPKDIVMIMIPFTLDHFLPR